MTIPGDVEAVVGTILVIQTIEGGARKGILAYTVLNKVSSIGSWSVTLGNFALSLFVRFLVIELAVSQFPWDVAERVIKFFNTLSES